MSRVVVTGLGAVSPVGLSVSDYWSALVAGEVGIAAPTLVAADSVNTKVVAEVKGFAPADHFAADQVGFLDRVSQFAVLAARQAIAQSGLPLADGLSDRTAILIGTAGGGQTTHDDAFRRLYADGAARLHPLTIPKAITSAPASQISIAFGVRGPTFVVGSACASGTHAIGQAFHMVRHGQVPCAIAGGAEACITSGTLRAWEAMRILAPDTCRPFSRERKGLVLGEGAAILVLEGLEHARARGADILAEVVGFGMSADAKDQIAPDPAGMARAVTAALADGGLNPEDVDYVNAHGTGTVSNDRAETEALHRAFADHARQLAVSSTKSMVGHALGASGALELVATVMAIREDVVPPTANYLGEDPDCDLNYVANEARQRRVRAAISNSFAFGGLNGVLAMRKFVD